MYLPDTYRRSQDLLLGVHFSPKVDDLFYFTFIC